MRQLKITKSITNRESASLDKYLQEIGKEELITVEEEVELAQRIKKGDRTALEKLTRAKIELAQRHEQLSKSAGGDQLAKYTNELADMTIEFAEKTAALQVLGKQLGQTQQQFMTATVVNPQASRIRQAIRAFEIADQRVDELNTRSANLRHPVVSMLGGK